MKLDWYDLRRLHDKLKEREFDGKDYAHTKAVSNLCEALEKYLSLYSSTGLSDTTVPHAGICGERSDLKIQLI